MPSWWVTWQLRILLTYILLLPHIEQVTFIIAKIFEHNILYFLVLKRWIERLWNLNPIDYLTISFNVLVLNRIRKYYNLLQSIEMSGYQRASKGDFGNDRLVELDKSINRYRWFLLFFNVLSILVALVTFCVCIWIR